MNLSTTLVLPVAQLIRELGDKNPAVRESARKQLIHTGGRDVTRALAEALHDSRKAVRWEAAKALKEIGDPVAAAALSTALSDEDSDVRWIVGEALIALGMVGLHTVLTALMSRAGSVVFRIATHHVLSELKYLSPTVDPVLRALHQWEPALTAPPAAYNAMITLRGGF